MTLFWSQWDDVVAKQAKLEEERRETATVNAQRRSLISQETEETEKHHGKLQKSLEDSLRELRQTLLATCNKGFDWNLSTVTITPCEDTISWKSLLNFTC